MLGGVHHAEELDLGKESPMRSKRSTKSSFSLKKGDIRYFLNLVICGFEKDINRRINLSLSINNDLIKTRKISIM